MRDRTDVRFGRPIVEDGLAAACIGRSGLDRASIWVGAKKLVFAVCLCHVFEVMAINGIAPVPRDHNGARVTGVLGIGTGGDKAASTLGSSESISGSGLS